MDPAASRTGRRESQRAATRRRRRRIGLAVGGALVLIAAIVVAAVTVGSGSSGDSATKSTTSDAGPGVTVTLVSGDIATDSAGPATSFSPAQAQQVLGTIRTYLDSAVITPLRSGQPAGDLSTVFDAGTLARVTGVDRGVMLEEGLPKVTGDVTVVGKPVSFVGLGDQSGTLVLVTAAVEFTIDGTVSGVKAPLHIEQHGDLVLAPDASGAWKVTSYRMAVTRSGGGIDTTASSTTATTKAAK